MLIGARSAVFAPIESLGVIVVDEEHETTYKQGDNPRYHARDVAVWRAARRGAVAILGSDTFDVAEVDVTTLAFGPGAAPLAHRNGPHPKDANHDGVPDLLAHFRTEDAGIAPGDEEACVTGTNDEGVPFEACDSVLVF